MKGQEISYAVRIEAAPQRVWDILADFGKVANYNPNVTSSTLTSETEEGVGATRHCDLSMFGASIEERIVEWNAGESLGIEIYESKRLPIVRDQRASLRVEPEGSGAVLSGTLTYRVGLGPIGAAINALAVRKQLTKGWRGFLAGVKLHAETGTLVDGDTPVPVEDVRPAA